MKKRSTCVICFRFTVVTSVLTTVFILCRTGGSGFYIPVWHFHLSQRSLYSSTTTLHHLSISWKQTRLHTTGNTSQHLLDICAILHSSYSQEADILSILQAPASCVLFPSGCLKEGGLLEVGRFRKGKLLRFTNPQMIPEVCFSKKHCFAVHAVVMPMWSALQTTSVNGILWNIRTQGT